MLKNRCWNELRTCIVCFFAGRSCFQKKSHMQSDMITQRNSSNSHWSHYSKQRGILYVNTMCKWAWKWLRWATAVHSITKTNSYSVHLFLPIKMTDNHCTLQGLCNTWGLRKGFFSWLTLSLLSGSKIPLSTSINGSSSTYIFRAVIPVAASTPEVPSWCWGSQHIFFYIA